MKNLITILFLISLLPALKAQDHVKQDLVHSWKLKKVIVNGVKNKNKLVNDHLVLKPDGHFEYFDNDEAENRFVTVGIWQIDTKHRYIRLKSTNTGMVGTYKILQIDKRNFVYEMTVPKAKWEVHMKSED